MNRPRSHLLFLCLLLGTALPACSSASSVTSSEESGLLMGKSEPLDQVIGGVRLWLAYDSRTNSFQGFVENTTGQELKNIRVGVQLDNGTELGPTYAVDLQPGERHNVAIAASFSTFQTWTAQTIRG